LIHVNSPFYLNHLSNCLGHATNQKSEVIVHRRDGRIREKNSYGNDPYPPKG